MAAIAYINGVYCKPSAPTLSLYDRGYQFGDGVYEVIALVRGQLIDTVPHLNRLDFSLRETDMPWPVSREALQELIFQVQLKNGVQDGMVLIQVTRGSAPRAHAYSRDLRPNLSITVNRLPPMSGTPEDIAPVKVISHPDLRWARPDIKSLNLLPNLMAKQKAQDAGCYEAFLVNDKGWVTEGSLSNAWIVDQTGTLRTHPDNGKILSGITRKKIIEIINSENLPFQETPFTLEEVRSAREAFVSGSTAMIKPVVAIDDSPIGTGQLGPITKKLMQTYYKFCFESPHD